MTKLREKQNIPLGWQEHSLGHLLFITKGKLPKKIFDVADDNSVPYLSIKNLEGNEFRYADKTDGLIADKEDLLVIGDGSGSGRMYRGHAGLVSSTFLKISSSSPGDVSNDYLEVLFLHLDFTNSRFRKGGAIPHFDFKQLKDIQIPLPPIQEQQKIAEILVAVNEDIEKTKAAIKATENLKRGLMQELFTRGIGHTKFKQTELGEIPEGWKVCELSTVSKVERGKFSHRPRNDSRFFGGDIPFIQTGDVVNSGGRVKTYSQSLNQKGLEVSKFFPAGTIVLTIAANIGDTAILEFDSCFPDSLVGITVNPGMDNIFLEYFLSTRKKYLNGIATQSAQKNINLQKLNPMFVIVPDFSEQKLMAEILLSVDEKITINKKLLAKQTELKKGLMQDLLSGVKRVKI